ncbi:DUF3667 domain-containing protein [Psychroserpens sp. XS_ASV72]|uniref:DUF3667 domain-containing protein n=1 Tax=Psychroserpens sp. XS_ASV72 TaxID=3241293 RepID=UPI003513ED05
MNCKNCDTALSKLINYCPICGAKIVRKRLTLKNISADVTQQFLNIDNKFLKTFTHLFTNPGHVINSFIDGTRKKYINVIQYFAIALTLVGIQVFLMNTFFEEAFEIDYDFLKDIEKNPNQKNNPFGDFDFKEFNNYQSLVYTLTVPLTTLGTWITYFILGIRRLNFTEHLVLNLYYSAQIIIITAISSILFLCFGFDYLLISTAISILTFGYLFYVLKSVFKTSFWETVIHFLVFCVMYAVVIFIVMILAALIGFVYVLLNKEQFVNTV